MRADLPERRRGGAVRTFPPPEEGRGVGWGGTRGSVGGLVKGGLTFFFYSVLVRGIE